MITNYLGKILCFIGIHDHIIVELESLPPKDAELMWHYVEKCTRCPDKRSGFTLRLGNK